MNRRSYLDLLRCVAILLVIGHHFPAEQIANSEPHLAQILQVWKTGGWCGVDLFFVLSGYLVTGLLFQEIKKTQNINLRSFFIRRSLKILPSFLFFWLLGSLFAYFFATVESDRFSAAKWILELSFLQNYFGGLWPHTWSLAIEVHFYLLIGILVYGFKKKSRLLLPVFIFLLAAVFIIRMISPAGSVNFATHTRIDSLLFGSLLSYFFHFKTLGSIRLRPVYCFALAVTGIILAVPSFLQELTGSPLFLRFGYTINYLAAGFLILAAVFSEERNRPLLNLPNAIGRHSYSIYLWNFPVLYVFLYLAEMNLIFDRGSPWYLPAYLVTTIAVGVVISKAIEKPALSWRDRQFTASY